MTEYTVESLLQLIDELSMEIGARDATIERLQKEADYWADMAVRAPGFEVVPTMSGSPEDVECDHKWRKYGRGFPIICRDCGADAPPEVIDNWENLEDNGITLSDEVYPGEVEVDTHSVHVDLLEDRAKLDPLAEAAKGGWEEA